MLSRNYERRFAQSYQEEVEAEARRTVNTRPQHPPRQVQPKPARDDRPKPTALPQARQEIVPSQTNPAPTVAQLQAQPKPQKHITHGPNDPPIGEISLVPLELGTSRTCRACNRKLATAVKVYWWNNVCKVEYPICANSWCHGAAHNYIEHKSKQPAPTTKAGKLAEQQKTAQPTASAQPAWLLKD